MVNAVVVLQDPVQCKIQCNASENYLDRNGAKHRPKGKRHLCRTSLSIAYRANASHWDRQRLSGRHFFKCNHWYISVENFSRVDALTVTLGNAFHWGIVMRRRRFEIEQYTIVITECIISSLCNYYLCHQF